jgi:hypothetical protein
MSNPNDNIDPDKMTDLQFALTYGILTMKNAKKLIDNHNLILERIREVDANLLATFQAKPELEDQFILWLEQMKELGTPEKILNNIAETQGIIQTLSNNLENGQIGQTTFDAFFFDMNKATQEIRDIAYAELYSVIEVVKFDFGTIIEEGEEIPAHVPLVIEIGNTAVDSAWRTLAYADRQMYE